MSSTSAWEVAAIIAGPATARRPPFSFSFALRSFDAQGAPGSGSRAHSLLGRPRCLAENSCRSWPAGRPPPPLCSPCSSFLLFSRLIYFLNLARIRSPMKHSRSHLRLMPFQFADSDTTCLLSPSRYGQEQVRGWPPSSVRCLFPLPPPSLSFPPRPSPPLCSPLLHSSCILLPPSPLPDPQLVDVVGRVPLCRSAAAAVVSATVASSYSLHT